MTEQERKIIELFVGAYFSRRTAEALCWAFDDTLASQSLGTIAENLKEVGDLITANDAEKKACLQHMIGKIASQGTNHVAQWNEKPEV